MDKWCDHPYPVGIDTAKGSEYNEMWKCKMNQWIRVLLIVALTLTFATPVLAAPAVQDDDEVEMEGPIEALGDGYIVVGGVTFWLDADTLLRIKNVHGAAASTADLVVGQWVDVSGTRQPDGTVVAQHVWLQRGPDDDADGVGPAEHPVALRIAEMFGVDYDGVMALYESGVSFGWIAKAYMLAEVHPQGGLTGADLIAMRQSGLGWGEICQQTGIHPSGGKPPWAAPGNGHGSQDDDSNAARGNERENHPGQGNANGHDHQP